MPALIGKGKTKDGIERSSFGANFGDKKMEEIKYGQCEYCGYEAELSELEIVPAIDDEAAWAELREKHADSCEWVATRAHRSQF